MNAKEFQSTDIKMTVSLEEYIEGVIDRSAVKAADLAVKNTIQKHELSCPVRSMKDTLVEDHSKLDKLGVKFYLSIGALAGLSGGIGSIVSSLFKG